MHGGDIYRNSVEVDFSINVNPLGMPMEVAYALEEAVEMCDRYPDPRAWKLCEALGAYLEVAAEQICPGNGASELIMALTGALHPRRVLLQAPSFAGYERACKSLGDCRVEYIRTNRAKGAFLLPEECVEQLTKAVDMVILANPNNPTGCRIEEELLTRIADKAREQNITLVIDECFIEFMEQSERLSFVSRLGEYPNVILLRAFTKICAIPGVRLGYSVCSNGHTNQRIREKLAEWNVSVPAQQAGIAAAKVLRKGEYLSATRKLLREQRDYLAEGLRKLGMNVMRSEANFLLFHSERSLFEPLLDRGILLRDCSDFTGLGEGDYRVAVRTADENVRLLDAIGQILDEVG